MFPEFYTFPKNLERSQQMDKLNKELKRMTWGIVLLSIGLVGAIFFFVTLLF
jgi:hypothetical protein